MKGTTDNLPLVYVIVVNWNGKQHLEYCIPSVMASDYPNFRVVLSDNGSDDGSREFVAERFPDVHIINNRGNIGFTGGNNAALRYAIRSRADYALLLNSDTKIEPDCISELVRVALLDPEIAFLGCKIMSWDGRTVEYAGNVFHKIYMEGGYANEPDRGQFEQIEYVAYTCGGAMMTRLDVLSKIGLFDSSFFMYSEDVDLCFRAWIAGYKSVYVPRAIAYHRLGGGELDTDSKRYFGRKNSMTAILKNYEQETLRKYWLWMFKHFVQDKEGRNWKALSYVMWNLPRILKERAKVQQMRVRSDHEIFETIENVQAPYGALLRKEDAVTIGVRDSGALGRGWGPIESMAEGKVKARCTMASARFCLFARRPSRITLHVLASGESEPLSGKVQLNGRFVGNICVNGEGFREFPFPVPGECVRDSVVAGEIKLNHDGDDDRTETCPDERGIYVAKIWLSYRSPAVPRFQAGPNVLMVGYSDFTGPGVKHIFHFANELVRNGYRVMVAHPLDARTIHMMHGPALFEQEKVSFDRTYLFEENVNNIRRFNPDIVHLWTPRYVPSLVGLTAKKYTRAKLLIQYEDDEDILYDRHVVDGFFAMRRELHSRKNHPERKSVVHPSTYTKINRQADAFTAICRPWLERLEKQWNKKVYLLYPGVDTERFKPTSKDPDLMKKFDLEGRTVLMYSGNIHKAVLEDFFTLLQAMKTISSRVSNVLLVHLGLNYFEEDTLRRVTELGLERHTLFVGMVDHKDMHHYLSVADVLMQGGENDTFNEYRLPSKIPEYLAMGKPIITFKVGIGRELVDMEEIIKLERGDAKELADKTVMLIKKEDLRERIGRGARRKADQLFCWKRNTETLMRAYEEVLNAP